MITAAVFLGVFPRVVFGFSSAPPPLPPLSVMPPSAWLAIMFRVHYGGRPAGQLMSRRGAARFESCADCRRGGGGGKEANRQPCL